MNSRTMTVMILFLGLFLYVKTAFTCVQGQFLLPLESGMVPTIDAQPVAIRGQDGSSAGAYIVQLYKKGDLWPLSPSYTFEHNAYINERAPSGGLPPLSQRTEVEDFNGVICGVNETGSGEGTQSAYGDGSPDDKPLRVKAITTASDFDEMADLIQPESIGNSTYVIGKKNGVWTVGYQIAGELSVQDANNPWYLRGGDEETGRACVQNEANWGKGDPNLFEVRDLVYCWHRFYPTGSFATLLVPQEGLMWSTVDRHTKSPMMPFSLTEFYVHPQIADRTYTDSLAIDPYTQEEIDYIEDIIMGNSGEYIGKCSIPEVQEQIITREILNSTTCVYTEDTPFISLSPTTLSPVCAEGENAATKTFTIINRGIDTLNYTIRTDVPWVDCTPSSGASTGESDTITVTYNTSGLSVGTYSGTITISDPVAPNSPKTIPVALTVNAQTVSIGFQAEDYVSTQGSTGCVLNKYTDSAALGERYVLAEGIEILDSPSRTYTYNVDIPIDGSFYLYVKIAESGDGTDDNSFFANTLFDNDSPTYESQHIPIYDDLTWSLVGISPISVSQGSYTYTISPREDGTRIDAFVFSTDPNLLINLSDTELDEIVGGSPPPVENIQKRECVEADWSYTDGQCQADSTLARTWTLVGDCEGGVTHPGTEQVACEPDDPGSGTEDGPGNGDNSSGGESGGGCFVFSIQR